MPHLEMPELAINIFAIDGPKVWPRFGEHHYMSHRYAGHRAWLASLADGEEVGFISVIRFPHGNITNGWRGHRTIVLPDFQGLGLGARLTNWLGDHVQQDMRDSAGNRGRLYVRTVHPRLGVYRNNSDKWLATTSNEKVGSKPSKSGISATALMRTSFSHEYVGAGGGVWCSEHAKNNCSRHENETSSGKAR